jgi:peroxiredoxin Q/BCP
MIRTAILVAALALVPAVSASQEDEPRVPKNTGPRNTQQSRVPPVAAYPIEGETWVGMRAHDFMLDGSEGREVKLSDLRGQWVVLAFADRKEDVRSMQSIAAKLHEQNIRLVGLCHEKAHGLERFAKQEKISFLILADPTGQVSSVYGLFNRVRGETVPGLLMVDPDGYVQAALLGRLPPPDQTAALARFVAVGY